MPISVLLPPEPPKPNLYLDDLDYIYGPLWELNSTYAACLWLPKRGSLMKIRSCVYEEKVYEKGLGFLLHHQWSYELKPEYERFVAKVGIDDNLIDHELGRNLVMHCSVVISCFIDGKNDAESPVMRNFAGAMAF